MNSRTRRSSRGPQLGDRVVLAISGTVVLIAAGLIVNSVSIAASSPLTRNVVSQPSVTATPQPSQTAAPQQDVAATPTAEPTATPTPTTPAAMPTTTAPATKPVQPKPTVPVTKPAKPKPVVTKKPVVKPTPAKTTVAVTPGSNQARDLVAQTNQKRVAAGLKPLTLDACLNNKLSQPWALTMSTTGVLRHSDLTQVFASCPTFKTAGENIAINQNGVSGVVDAWMKSTQHRANILNPKYTRIGVGIHTDAKGKTYWVQIFAG